MAVERPLSAFYREFEPTKEDLQIFKEWIMKMPHIVQDTDEYFLSALIRAKKGRIHEAKKILENMNALGYRCPKGFGHLDPLNKTTQDFLNANFMLPLPKRTDDGSLLCFFSANNDPDVDLSNYNWYEFLRFWFMTMTVLFWEKLEGNTKIIMIYDLSKESLARWKSMSPKLVMDLLHLFDNVPARIQAIHFAALPSFVHPFVEFAKNFTKSKAIHRLQCHSSMDSVYEKVPRELFPKEYGGSEPSVKTLNDLWRKKVESYRDKLIETSDKARKLDPLRPKSEENNRELEGTFRQIHID